jgi:hypothetical protein
MGYTPKKASSRLPCPSTLSTSVSLHQAMLDRTLTELPNPMIHTGTANVDNDCLYYGQAIKANDRDNFRKAMSVELKAHINQGHWVKMPRTDLPNNVKPIKMVWSFKCKRRPMDHCSSTKPACAFTAACKRKESTSGKPICLSCDGLPYDSC